MINLVKDIEENCPECNCDIEKTVKYLYKHGDIHESAERYREINRFYLAALEMEDPPKKKKKARSLTLFAALEPAAR